MDLPSFISYDFFLYFLLLAYAQKNEFEESIEQLKQEIVDQAEDRKIGEKKTHSLIKDLKKQDITRIKD